MMTQLHIELLKYKEHHDQLKCKASEAIGEQDKPFDCIEIVLDKHAEQAKLLDTMISKHDTLLYKVKELVFAYKKRDVVMQLCFVQIVKFQITLRKRSR